MLPQNILNRKDDTLCMLVHLHVQHVADTFIWQVEELGSYILKWEIRYKGTQLKVDDLFPLSAVIISYFPLLKMSLCSCFWGR